MINDIVNGTGAIIDDPSQVGGWITPSAGTGCIDSDHDGMPDAWEIARGLNPNDPSDGRTDRNGDGYTNLEDYLNGTAPNTSHNLNSNPTSWDYGVVKVRTTSAGKVFTVKNTGHANLVITGAPSLAGSNPSQFHITADTCSSATLILNGTCGITATFHPATAGAKTAYISIPDNATGNPHKIQLSGRGGTEQSLNGGFNTYPSATAKIPTNWVAANFASTDGKDTINKKEGLASVKIANTSVRTKTLTQTRVVSGATGSTFLLSLWGKGQGIPTTAGVVQARILLYSGTTLVQTKTITFANGTYGFTQKSITFTAPGAYNKIVIKLIYSKGSGSIWFDGLSLLRSP